MGQKKRRSAKTVQLPSVLFYSHTHSDCRFAGQTVSLTSASDSVLFPLLKVYFWLVFTWHTSWQTDKQTNIVFPLLKWNLPCVTDKRSTCASSVCSLCFPILKIIICRLSKGVRTHAFCSFSVCRLADRYERCVFTQPAAIGSKWPPPAPASCFDYISITQVPEMSMALRSVQDTVQTSKLILGGKRGRERPHSTRLTISLRFVSF